jgi:hypothetical protein
MVPVKHSVVFARHFAVSFRVSSQTHILSFSPPYHHGKGQREAGVPSTAGFREEGSMKRFAMSLGVLVLLAACTALAAGEDKYAGLTKEKYDAAVANLLIGLKSDNLGLKTSAAFMLGELKAHEAVVPLMALLHSPEPDCCRIVAALALCRIGDEWGVFAVKRAVKFDESREVAQKCAWFYEQYVQPGTYGFVSPSVATAAR